MATNDIAIILTSSEMMRMQMILIDHDGDDALRFLQEVRLKIESSTKKGMRSHLDK
jgi:hypothetical protein